MRITSKEILSEENQGQILLQTNGSTRVTVDGTGNVAFAGGIAPTGSITGAVKIGGATDTVGFFGATPVAVQSTTGTTGTFAAAAGTAALSASTWTGTSGSKAYTVNDIVTALKNYGILSA